MLGLLLLLLTLSQSFWKEKEHRPALETTREAEDRQVDPWEKLKSRHQWCQDLGDQIAPHLTETDYDHLLPKKQGPLTGSQSLPTSLAQTTATLCRPVGCSWDPCK